MDSKQSEYTQRKRFNVAKTVVVSGFILSLVVCTSIIVSSLYLLVWEDYTTLPQPLAEWAGVALGFLFGTFFTLVKDFIGDA